MRQRFQHQRWIGFGCSITIALITLFSLISPIAWHPYLELTAHFKVQYGIVSLLLLLGVLGRSPRRWILLAVGCLTLQFAILLPWYLPLTWATPPAPHNVRVLLANVYYRNQNPHKLLDLIASDRPDLIVIQEKTPAWLTALAPLQPDYPHFFQAPDDIAIWSRFPLHNPRLIGVENQSSITATVTISGQPVAIVATHPPPPKPSLVAQRNAEFEWVTHHIQQQPLPVILLGDLNTTMWSPYYRQLEQKTGLTNVRQGFGILPTWPAPTPYAHPHPLLPWVKRLLWIPIDHCLVSPPIQVRSLRPGPNIDSDHLPLIADLWIPCPNKVGQDQPPFASTDSITLVGD